MYVISDHIKLQDKIPILQKHIAFVQDGDEYRIDPESIASLFDHLEALANEAQTLEDINEDLRDHYVPLKYMIPNSGVMHESADKQADSELEKFRNEIKDLKKELSDVVITYDDWQAYSEGKNPESITNYFDILDRMLLAVDAFDYHGIMSPDPVHTPYDRDMNEGILAYFNQQQKDDADSRSIPHGSDLILNKSNPFSDVVIDNQSYIYPDQNGKYERLFFAEGYKLTKLKIEDQNLLAVIPNFDVGKQKITDPVQTGKVKVDDTVSTKLPDVKEGKNLFYLTRHK